MATWRRDSRAVPERVARFVLSEWPGAHCPHEAVRQWEAACADWLAADSTRTPRSDAGERYNRWWLAGGTRRVLPFGEYGDGVDLLREGMRLSHAMPPCPHEYRPAQWRGESGA
jgi:hypothetical protein